MTATDFPATADRIVELLGLVPGTCGFMSTTFRSPLEVAPPGAASRTIGQALYFLVTPQARVQCHRIGSDQVYHHYAGAPLEVLLVPEDGQGRVVVVGTDLAAGMRPQLLVPARTFHAARVLGAGSFSLMGTTSWPGVAEGEFERGDAATLARLSPSHADVIPGFVTG
jgi:predicted cupin superfamily sugar epimerase